MNKEEYMKKIAYLESINDHLTTELSNADLLMRMVGFEGGLSVVKATAQDLRDQQITDIDAGDLE